jgi:hypothetical protein
MKASAPSAPQSGLTSTYLAENSSYMENVLRHRFLFDVSRFLLLRNPPLQVSISRSEVDDSGVDLVLTVGAVTRHIQMKTVATTDRPNEYAIKESLSLLPGGCVIWMCYDRESLQKVVYHLMGGCGNELMPALTTRDQAMKKKKDGTKVPRLGYRAVRMKHASHRNLSLETLVPLLFALPAA